MGKVIEISRTIKALRRAHFAAADRHDHNEANRLRDRWYDTMDMEREAPVEGAADAGAKLWWACY